MALGPYRFEKARTLNELWAEDALHLRWLCVSDKMSGVGKLHSFAPNSLLSTIRTLGA